MEKIFSEEDSQTLIFELASADQWPLDDTGWLDTTWMQGVDSFYNDSCPDDPNTSPGIRPDGHGTTDGKCLTGCVATAMGQIINYWRYPSSVIFTSTQDYVSSIDPNDGYGTRITSIHAPDANMSYIDYNYGYPSQSTIADLLFACGVSVKMRYSDAGSGAWIWHPSAEVDAERAFQNTFGYQVQGKLGTDTDFYDILEDNMKEGQPALLGIFQSGYINGHAIVADGFRSTGEFHLNFGWGPKFT